MNYPLSTGHAAVVLGTTEPRLAETVRRGKVDPAPPVFAGRRMWEAEHLLQAAEHLGLLTPELQERLGQEVTHARK